MQLWDLFTAVNPYVRVTTAVCPFAVAIAVRLFFGRNRFTTWMVSVSTMWFLLNVLLAPYSPGMRDDIEALESIWR